MTTVLSTVGGGITTANLVTVEQHQQNTPVSVSLGNGRTAVAVSAGGSHTCAILDDGSLKCWGMDSYGQLGDGGSNTDKNTPVSVSLGTGRTAVAVSAGGYHTCAILDDGSLKCWGYDSHGQLGDGGSNTNKDTPVSVSLGTTTNPRTAALSERDFDNDGTLNVFESTSPSLVSCTAGQYGFYMCVDAPLGKYVPSSGSRYATDASAGYYVDSTLGAGQSTQTACLAGTYNPNTSSTSPSACGDADAGYYVDSTLGSGQPSQTACLAGTYNPNTGSTSSSACGDADAGYYVPTTGQSTQLAADAGFYVPITGQSTQTACLAGTYNPNTGSTSSSACGDADAGYYVLSTGQSTQTACLAGTYQATTGQTSCDDADAGFYVQSNRSIHSNCLLSRNLPSNNRSDFLW